MKTLGDIADQVIRGAIEQAAIEGMSVFTFALYFDHESPALSVCIDTKDNSAQQVHRQNEYSARYFHEHVDSGELERASRWQANIGRNLSLGDFERVNVCRTELRNHSRLSEEDCLDLVRRLRAYSDRLTELAENPEDLILCCTTPTDEVGVVWAPTGTS